MVTSNEVPPAQIPEFYAGRSLLVTGATGFMGQVLVERLLSICPRIGPIHLLMRAKKNDSAEKRLQNLKESPIFARIRERNPSALDKLRLLEGDIVQPGLGLSQDAIKGLQDVSIMFHSAAVVKFDEPLEVAVQQNICSVLRILELGDCLPKMEALMYISTAYSNSELSVIEERVYPPPVKLADLLTLTETCPPKLLADICEKYIQPKPNTYTFSKALAEVAVEEHGCKKYPIGIFRPTMVVSSLAHPFPGWVQSLSGPVGVALAAGKGVLHVFGGRRSARLDMLPVDMAIDTLIAAAWEVTIDRMPEVRVYNCSTGDNPVTLGQYEDQLRVCSRAYPLDDVIWYPSGFTAHGELSKIIWPFLLNTIPLYIVDYIYWILGIKPRVSFITISNRLGGLNKVLNFFASRDWVFVRDNTRKLKARLSSQDAAILNLDPMSINWNQHIKDLTIGVRRYQLKEKDEDIPKAKQHMRRMCLVHYAALTIFSLLVLRLVMTFKPISTLVLGVVQVLHSIYSAISNRYVA